MEEDTGKNSHVGGATGPHPRRRPLAGRLQPCRHPADRDRHQAARGARPIRPRGRARLRHRAARPAPRAGGLGCSHGAGIAALRRQRVAAAAPGRAAGHAIGDEERELPPRRSSGRCGTRSAGRPRCSPTAAEWSRRPGTGTRTRRLTTPGRSKEEAEDYRYFPEPDLVPIAPLAEWVEQLRATLPENPAERRERLASRWGITEFEMASVINSGALDLVEATVAAGADQAAARKWWTGELSAGRRERGVELADLADHAGAGRRGRGTRGGRDGQRQARPAGARRGACR